MDYEKAYKDALSRAKDCHVNKKFSELDDNAQQLCEYIFPELKKSENEIWRNWLIGHLKGYINQTNDRYAKVCKEAIAWLEKQCEQNPADSYCQDNCKGFQETGKCYADGECKAKRDAENKPTQEIESFEAEHGKYYYCIKDYFCGGRKQASKGDVVQALRGLPIMSLKDASEYFLPVNNVQNPVWSEKDEEYCRYIIDFYLQKSYGETALAIEWLENLKNRVQPQWKPTEEQMKALERTIRLANFGLEEDRRKALESILEQLKKL